MASRGRGCHMLYSHVYTHVSTFPKRHATGTYRRIRDQRVVSDLSISLLSTALLFSLFRAL